MAAKYQINDEPVPSYKLVEFLGRGGFGEVWRASAPGGTDAALKIISLSGKQGYKEFRALKLVKRIRHPNLVPINAFWLKDDRGFVLDDTAAESAASRPSLTESQLRGTMLVGHQSQLGRPAELIIAIGLGDKNLYDRLQECEREGLPGIPPEELLDYMEDSARAIDFLNSASHDLGSGPVAIQHCDIKPQNIMIVGGAVQVCDFGLARALEDDVRMTTVGGSPAYSSPECLQGKPPSKSTDQYSLAISFVELRTGTLPFDTESLMGVINAHLNSQLNLSRLPESERAVILRATAVDPEQRYPSAMKMVRALRRAYEGSSGGEAPEAAPKKESSTGIQSAAGMPQLAPGLELIPGYKLARHIVRGNTNDVWEATAPGNKRVALLVRDLTDSGGAIDGPALTLFRGMNHQHITRLDGYWLLDRHGQPVPEEIRDMPNAPPQSHLVLAGGLAQKTLVDRLEECRKQTGAGIPADELLDTMRQLADAIDYLNAREHVQGGRKVSVVHCSIRPVNFLLQGGVLKLGNPGRARVLAGTSMEVSTTNSGFEHPYTPPEVLNGRITKWSDQYLLAIAYVQLRTGKLPFDAASSTSRLVQIQLEGKLDLGLLSPTEAEVIAKATALTPESRFPTCREMVAALEMAVRSSADVKRKSAPAIPTPEKPATPPPPLPSAPPSTRQTPGPSLTVTEPLPDAAPNKRGYSDIAATMFAPAIEPSVASEQSRQTQPLSAPLSETPSGRLPLHPPTDIVQTAMEMAPPRLTPTEQPAPETRRPSAAAWSGRRNRTPLFLGTAAAGALGVGVWLIFFRDNEKPAIPPVVVKTTTGDNHKSEEVKSKTSLELKTEPVKTSEKTETEIPVKTQPTPVMPPKTDVDKLLADAETQLDVDAKATTILATEALKLDDLTPLHRRRALLLQARAFARLKKWQDMAAALASLGTPEDSEKPRVVMLRLWAIAERDPGELSREVATLLALRQPEDLTRQLDATERQQYEAIVSQAVRQVRAAAAAKSPKDGLADLASVAPLAPNDFSLAFDKATFEVKLPDYKAAQLSLEAAGKLATTPAQKSQLDGLTQLLALLTQSGDLPKAIESVGKRLADASPALRVPLCQALATLAKSHPQHIDAVAKLLGQAYQLDPQESEIVRAYIPVAMQQTRPDFAQLLMACRAAEKQQTADRGVRMCLWECLLETMPADASTSAAAPYREAVLTNELVDPYSRYLRAVALGLDSATNSVRLGTELDALMGLVHAKDLPPSLRADARRKRLGALYSAATDTLRVPTKDLRPAQLLGDPFGDEKTADRAHQWLLVGQELGAADSPRRTLNTLLAAASRTEPDLATIKKLIPSVVAKADSLGADAIPVLAVHARALAKSTAANERLESWSTYHKIIAQVRKAPPEDDNEAVLVSTQLLDPALALTPKITELTSEQKALTASLHALRGRLIRENPYANWPFKNLEQAAYAAYDQAIQLDKTKSEYFVGRGQAKLGMKDATLADVRQDAVTATTLDPKHHGGHGLLGNVLIQLSRQAINPVERQALLADAVKSCNQAVTLAEKDDEMKVSYLVSRSAANLELANFTTDPTMQKQKEFLNQAVQDAGLAKGAHQRYPEYAAGAMGNALEDLAWLCGQTEKYADAVTAFNEAIEARPARVQGYIDLGRCQFKRVAYGKQDAIYLENALRGLGNAVKRDPKAAEAHYWLGRVYTHRKEYDQADAAFTQAKDANPKFYDSIFWQAKAAAEQGNFAKADDTMAQAVGVALQQKATYWVDFYASDYYTSLTANPATLKARLPALGKLAQQLSALTTPGATLLVGGIRELEGKSDEALQAYTKALPTDVAKADASHVVLLAARSRLYYGSKKLNEALRDADQAATLATNNIMKARLLAIASQARLGLARDADLETTKPSRERAADDLKKAVALAPNDPDAWLWSALLVKQWLLVSPSLSEERLKEARDILEKALPKAREPAQKDEINRLLGDLKKRVN